jgi:hypothetical protein
MVWAFSRGYSPENPLDNVLLVVGVLLFVVAAPWLVRRWWCDPMSIPDVPHPWASTAGLERARRAWRRSAVVGYLTLSFTTVGLVGRAFSSRLPPLRLLDEVASGAGAACLFLALSVRWFNRPRFVVPSPLRSELGTIADRRLARRKRRVGSA